MSVKKYGWAKLICIDQSRFYIFSHPQAESRIIGIPASCSYYSSMNKLIIENTTLRTRPSLYLQQGKVKIITKVYTGN